MARKTKTTETPVVNENKTVAEVKQETKQTVEKKKRTKKTTEMSAPVEEVKQVETPQTVETPVYVSDTPSDTPDGQKGQRKRRLVSKHSVEQSCMSVYSKLDAEINKLVEAKQGGVKFLKNVRKDVKTLLSDVQKVLKLKKRVKANINSSGFMKKVDVSNEMTSFLGLAKGEKYSRVEITKKLCNYIKDKNLQKQDNKRVILPNKELAHLLKLDKHSEPLTYPGLQKYIQHHIVKTE